MGGKQGRGSVHVWRGVVGGGYFWLAQQERRCQGLTERGRGERVRGRLDGGL